MARMAGRGWRGREGQRGDSSSALAQYVLVSPCRGGRGTRMRMSLPAAVFGATFTATSRRAGKLARDRRGGPVRARRAPHDEVRRGSLAVGQRAHVPLVAHAVLVSVDAPSA
jgi:hypothetical protein